MSNGYQQFDGKWEAKAQLALDTMAMKPTKGIPTWMVNAMEWDVLDHFAGVPRGSYREAPVNVYRKFQHAIGTCYIDQWIPTNPLSMTPAGFELDTQKSATTGLEKIVVDGIHIDSPEVVVQHLESVVFPHWMKVAEVIEQNADEQIGAKIRREVEVQKLFGMNMLKGPYDGFFAFPNFMYGLYGYENYFSAYALYPEVMERCFRLQADMAVRCNRISARAIVEGKLPPLVRCDHDMADSRGTLVRVETLDEIWFPHFARSVQPLLEAGVRLIWHCDGNLMAMVPRLIECGVSGFQGFQYEAGMDYERLCQMKDRDGNPLFIIAGVSVTRTLPMGTPDDVAKEIKWLVEKGPQVGLMLGCSSSMAPGVPMENVRTMMEGFAYYRERGRAK